MMITPVCLAIKDVLFIDIIISELQKSFLLYYYKDN
jgi:hypothetical protein